MKFRKLVLPLTLLALLGGCSSMSFLEGKKIDYKSAGKVPSLEVPPDLTAPAADSRYVVPDVSPQGSATFSAYNSERASQPQAGSTRSAARAGQGDGGACRQPALAGGAMLRRNRCGRW